MDILFSTINDIMIFVRKRNNLYEYRFETWKVNGKQITKSGFKTKNEAYITEKNYNKFINEEKVNECFILII